MTKRRTHKEIEQQIQKKLRRQFLIWFLVGSVGMLLLMLIFVGNKMNKESDILILILMSVVFTGLPLAFSMYWTEKWALLGYNTKTEGIITAILIGVSGIIGAATGSGYSISGIITINFIVSFIANIIHKKQYKQDAENGTIPDINLDRLDNGAWSDYYVDANSDDKDNSKKKADDEYDENDGL